jgi:hypothetical protein
MSGALRMGKMAKTLRLNQYSLTENADFVNPSFKSVALSPQSYIMVSCEIVNHCFLPGKRQLYATDETEKCSHYRPR